MSSHFLWDEDQTKPKSTGRNSPDVNSGKTSAAESSKTIWNTSFKRFSTDVTGTHCGSSPLRGDDIHHGLRQSP